MKSKIAISLKFHLANLFFALCTFNFALAQQYGWTELTGNLPDTSLYGGCGKVVFRGEHGWITQAWYGLPRKVFYTPDGGQTFTTQYLPDDAGTIGDIFMRSETEGYIVTYWDETGNSGNIFHTTDAQSDSWSLLSQVDGSGFYCISFPPMPAETGYIGSASGEIWKITGNAVSYDGWCNTLYDITDICFPVNSDEGWAIGGLSLQHRTLEGWQLADQNYSMSGIGGIWFADNFNGWVCGDNLYILNTTDGHNWITQHSGNSQSFHAIDFCDLNNGWAVGNGAIFHTTNGGAMWIDESDQIDAADIELTGLSVVDIHTAYAVGHRRSTLTPVFFKYAQMEGVDGQGGMEAWGHGGVEVFPNPTAGVVSLRPCLPAGGSSVFSRQLTDDSWQSASIELIDLYGNLLEFWNPGTLEPSNNGTIELNLSSYPPGIYFIRIISENEMIVNKIVKL